MSEIKKPKRHSLLPRGQSKHVSSAIRERVLEAAFSLFRENGFSSQHAVKTTIGFGTKPFSAPNRKQT